jgi:hypothetical protein
MTASSTAKIVARHTDRLITIAPLISPEIHRMAPNPGSVILYVCDVIAGAVNPVI